MGRASLDDFNLNGHDKMSDQMLSGFNHLTSALINLNYFVLSPRVEFLHRKKPIGHGRLLVAAMCAASWEVLVVRKTLRNDR